MGHTYDTGLGQGIEVYPDPDHLARGICDQFVTLARQVLDKAGHFTVALAGGSTPRAAYALLATDEYATRLDWPRIHIFWGDERCVPPDHPDSNYRMARQVLLDRVPLPQSNIHRMRGELAPAQAAARYEQELRAFFSPSPGDRDASSEPQTPRFDLILLGMGDDGHTASLFPGSQVIHEPGGWVAASYVEKLAAWRITLTPAIINAAANVTFLVSGSGKAECLRQVLTGPYRPHALPAQIVRPHQGCLRWLVDAAAASLLDRG